MALLTGKTNAHFIRIFIDDSNPTARDVSASVSSISDIGLEWPEDDVSGYSDGVRNFTLGKPDAILEIKGPVSTTASVGAHTVLSSIDGDMSQTYTVTIQIGIRAAPETGCPEFEGEYYCSKYKIHGDGTYSARLVPGSGTAPAWGTMT